MPERFNLSLGGIPISLIPDQTSGEYELIKRAADFRTNAASAVDLQVHCGWFPQLGELQVAFEPEHAWQLLQADGKWVIKLRSPGEAQTLLGVFPADFRSGDIYAGLYENTPGRYIFPLHSPLGELYLMNLLAGGLGMLFHAAGVIDRGQGYLFTGHGGAGKSTTARLWDGRPGVQVVNDDKVIVRKEAGGFRMYGSPWHGVGGAALPDSAPLTRVFILKQAGRNYTAPLPPVQAAGLLLARAFIPLWDAHKIDFCLRFLDELCQAVPCQELDFLPDASVVDFVKNLPS